MDESSEVALDPRSMLSMSTEQLNQKIEEWKEIVKRLIKKRFDATNEFVNKVSENLQKQLPAGVLEMSAESFIDKYIDASVIKDEPLQENLGNQTMAAIEQMQYLMNSSHHDEKTKEMAAKLQQVILSKK